MSSDELDWSDDGDGDYEMGRTAGIAYAVKRLREMASDPRHDARDMGTLAVAADILEREAKEGR